MASRFVSHMLTNWTCVSFNSITLTLIWLHYGKKKNKSNTKVFFYNPIENNGCRCQCTFNKLCEDVNCLNINIFEIIKCFQNAKKSINICVFTISNLFITKAIIAAHNRGVLVRIITNYGVLLNVKAIKHLMKSNIQIKYQSHFNNNYMHNKFCLVDCNWLINGSMNWTHQATYSNWESFFITDKQCLVNTFFEGFEKIWSTI